MAIINSLAIGKSVKSAGNLTYRTIRGRTIASQRIVSNKSNTAKQAAQRSSFSMSSQAVALCRTYVDYAYEKSKYGSARNEFMKTNPKFSLAGLVGEIKEGVVTLADGFLLSIAKPDNTERDINFISKGSLPAIVVGSQSIIPSFAYQDQTYKNINAWNVAQGYTVTFPTPVRVSDVEIVVIGFGVNSIITAIGSINPTTAGAGDFNMQGNPTLGDALSASRVVLSEDNVFVSSMTFKVSLPPVATSEFGCAVALPVVSGKTITTTAVWLPPTE